MKIEELRLDGNAASGMLHDVFAVEMTEVLAKCAGCGTAGQIGTLLEYGHGMGIVLRCRKCDAPVLRIARVPGRLHVDLSGVLSLTIPESVSLA